MRSTVRWSIFAFFAILPALPKRSRSYSMNLARFAARISRADRLGLICQMCLICLGMGALTDEASMPKVVAVYDTMTELRAGLDLARGHWPRISEDTGIDYFTIARIARGETRAPRIDTV